MTERDAAADTAAFFGDLAPYVDQQWRGDDLSDVDFYVAEARAADGPVLELGCGTGRVYLELLAAGVDADGLDLAPGALSVLRDRADERGLEPTVWRGDATDLAVDREYARVFFPFRGFLHVIDREDQLAVLRNVREALAPDGRFVLNFFAPGFDVVAEHYGEPTVTTVEVEGEAYRVETVTTLEDEVEQVAEIERTVTREADGRVVGRNTSPLKLLPKREFESLLELAGFDTWRVYDGFDREPVGDEAGELVWVVENRA